MIILAESNSNHSIDDANIDQMSAEHFEDENSNKNNNNDDDDEEEGEEEDDSFVSNNSTIEEIIAERTNYVRNIKQVENSHDLQMLRQSLLFRYDKNSRPLDSSLSPIKVQLDINIAQINNLDEVYQVRLIFTNE